MLTGAPPTTCQSVRSTGGTFVATIVFGVTFYLVEQGLSKTVYNLSQEGSTGAATGVFLLGVLLMIIEAVVIFLVADWTFNWLHA